MSSDEYELLLNQVNAIVTRRQTVTSTYLSVNAALTGAIAFLFKDGQLPNIVSQISVLTLLFSGVLVCSLWRRLIMQHSTLINHGPATSQPWGTSRRPNDAAPP